jgi:hypothetical protein
MEPNNTQIVFEIPPRPVIHPSVGDRERQVLVLVFSRPEFSPLSGSITIKTSGTIEGPFQVPSADQIILNPNALDNLPLAAFLVRYALELALWQRTMGEQASLGYFLAISIIGGITAKRYVDGMVKREREACLMALPHVCSFIHEAFFEDRWRASFEDTAVPQSRELLLRLFNLVGIEISVPSRITEEMLVEAAVTIERSEPVTTPVEFLLTAGGDDRLRINEKTGLNSYGCSPRPRPWAVTFASTTASSISEYAFAECERLRQKMIQAICDNSFDSFITDEYANLRREILHALELEDMKGLELAFTSSGTDAELLALFLSLSRGPEYITNILIGPEETGSGVLLAASGRHFMLTTPLGGDVERELAVEGIPTERVRLVEVPLRHNDGAFLESAELDSRVVTLVRKLIASGGRVLLHTIDSSKTGLNAPNGNTVYRLKEEYRDALDIVVDACQLRASNNKIRTYLERGFMVLITGSKFYTGPPFSGAMLIPETLANRVKDNGDLPAGFAHYFSCHDLPARWDRSGACLAGACNLGLLMRWQAALWEIKAFQAVSEKHKYMVFALFGESIREAINSNPDLELVPTPTTERWKLLEGMDWDWLPTIFTFLLFRNGHQGRRKPCTLEEAKKVYHLLNSDISNLIPRDTPEEESRLAARRYHIGQPVKINRVGDDWSGALRISAGARLVSGVRFDPELGRHFSQRLSREITEACEALDKISVILKYFSHIENSGAGHEPPYVPGQPCFY